MNMKKNIQIFFLLAFILSGGCFASNEASALTVSPPIKELGGDPGSTVEGIIKLYNETNTEITVYASTADFSARENGSGEPSFDSIEKSDDPKNMSNWISLPEGAITIKPMDWQNVIYKLEIPKNAEPGGHYAAAFFSPNDSGNESGQVSVDYKTGSLMLLNVSGEVRQKGSLKDFLLKNGRKFYEYAPVGFEVFIKNEGNVHFRPGGNVGINNMFGKKVGEFPIVETETGGNVLPSSTRKYDLIWEKISDDDLPQGFFEAAIFELKHFRFGKYTATLAAIFPGGETGAKNVSFFIIPWQLLSIIIGALLIVILVFRQYNRWIIKKARSAK
jgi:hypothetical protein